MQLYTLQSQSMTVTISDFGARIVKWEVTVGEARRSIVLGYKDLESYQHDPFYLGAIVGPFANRIKDGKVKLSVQSVQLTKNDADNHLHGGFLALDKQHWQVVHADQHCIQLNVICADGYNGYPGPTAFDIIYELNGHVLSIEIITTATKNTLSGATGHAYFNLNGVDSGMCGLQQWLQSNATHFTPKDEWGLPSGKDNSVEGTAFDFKQTVLLNSSAQYTGLDHNLVFNGEVQQSVLMSNNRDLSLVVTSDYPAAQFYTGYYLNGELSTNQGVCIEPHFGADAPNHKDNPQGIIQSHQISTQLISYEVQAQSSSPYRATFPSDIKLK